MAYIGQQPFQEFTSVPTKDSFTGDGSTTTLILQMMLFVVQKML